jgi:serine/threonine-protein kinase
VLPSWAKAWHEPASRAPDWKNTARLLVEKVIYGLAFLASAFLAARNLRAGRGDRRGAWRLSVAYFILLGAGWFCSAHYVADISMMQIFTTKAGEWFTAAALIWLLYIALEPVVRARWPHSLLTWSRLLAGRWQDAQVGAHVLYGALVGLIIAAFFLVSNWIEISRGSPGATASAEVGTSARYWMAGILHIARNAVEFGLIVVLVIFCLRSVFRKDWIASVAAAVLFTLTEGEAVQGNIVDFVFFLVIFTLLAFVLLRLGLLSTLVAIFFVNSLLQTPGAQALTKPYESAVVTYPVLALAIVVWAFWRTSGQQLLSVTAEDR